MSARRRVDTTPPSDPVPSDGKSRILLQIVASADGDLELRTVPEDVARMSGRIAAAMVSFEGGVLCAHSIPVAGVDTRYGAAP